MCDGVIATSLLRVQRLRDQIFHGNYGQECPLWNQKGEAWEAYLKGEVLDSVILYIRIHFIYCKSTRECL